MCPPASCLLENGRVDVVFDIVEGDKTGVKAIDFSGNNAFSSGRLRDQMTTTESNLLSFLKNSDVYDPDRIAADLELHSSLLSEERLCRFPRRLERREVRRGRGRLSHHRSTWTRASSTGSARSTSKSRIADIDPERLRGRVRLAAGETYNAEDVEKSLQSITTEVASRGYAFAQVRPQGNRDPATGTIGIIYVVEEGPRVYIERINVRGNTRTRDNVIRREFDVGEGDAYNKILMDKAERRLNNLGYFKNGSHHERARLYS